VTASLSAQNHHVQARREDWGASSCGGRRERRQGAGAASGALSARFKRRAADIPRGEKQGTTPSSVIEMKGMHGDVEQDIEVNLTDRTIAFSYPFSYYWFSYGPWQQFDCDGSIPAEVLGG